MFNAKVRYRVDSFDTQFIHSIFNLPTIVAMESGAIVCGCLVMLRSVLGRWRGTCNELLHVCRIYCVITNNNTIHSTYMQTPLVRSGHVQRIVGWHGHGLGSDSLCEGSSDKLECVDKFSYWSGYAQYASFCMFVSLSACLSACLSVWIYSFVYIYIHVVSHLWWGRARVMCVCVFLYLGWGIGRLVGHRWGVTSCATWKNESFLVRVGIWCPRSLPVRTFLVRHPFLSLYTTPAS